LAFRWKSVLPRAFGIAAQGGNVELSISVQNLRQLLGQLSPIVQPLAFGELAEVEVPPGSRIVPRVNGLEKRIHGALRCVAIQWIFSLVVVRTRRLGKSLRLGPSTPCETQ